jgi:two-component system LytT family sensor kinase
LVEGHRGNQQRSTEEKEFCCRHADSFALPLLVNQTGSCTAMLIGCILLISQAGNSTIRSMGVAPRSTAWLWIALIWAGVGLFDATQTIFVMRAEGMHHAWIRLFFRGVVEWLPWALATPIVLTLGRRYPPVKVRPISTWGFHLATCAVVGLVHAVWIAELDVLLNPWADPNPPGRFIPFWLDKFYNGLLSYVILYAAILAISYVLESRDRLARQRTETAQLNEQLSKAQLNALRRQIEPHFLFNALNAIAGLVREKRNDIAVDMIAGLSDFLRRTVQDSDRQQVPLAEEMEFLQNYLDIQKLRFADRLQLTVDVPRELLPVQVPSLILQPMVENAIKHGIAKRAQGGAIKISASRSNGRLTLNVYNDGPNLPRDWDRAQLGIGMTNTRTRLRSLYGDEFALSMRNQAPGGVEVSISLPFVCTTVPKG